MKGGPLRFLFGVALLWAGARAVMLWPAPGEAPGRVVRWAGPLGAVAATAENEMAVALPPFPSGEGLAERGVSAPSLPSPAREPVSAHTVSETVTSPTPNPSPKRRGSSSTPTEPVSPPGYPAPPRPDRVTVSSWMLLRPGIGDPLAPGGQLAGSQAGTRAALRVTEGVAFAARLSGPLRQPTGKEAAIGIDIRTGAVTLALERRIGLDRGGRDAFALTLFGGVDAVLLPGGFRLDAWGQTGIVGARRRDGFIDGIIRAERAVAGPVALGAGIWGGAQPGVARLDIGPQIVVRGQGLRLSAEWRQRIAGRARPGSGPAVTLGADF